MKTRRWLVAVIVTVVCLAAVGAGLLFVNLNVSPGSTNYASRIDDVVYYPACGNEVLEFEGRTWYPIVRENWQPPQDQALGVTGGAGIAMTVPMVAAPGPGDDVGTLYIWNMGRAYWASDNGDLATWLTLVPQSYNWVC